MAVFLVPDETHVCGHQGKVLTCQEQGCIEFRAMFEAGCHVCGDPFEQGYPYSMIRTDNNPSAWDSIWVALHERCV